MFSVHHGTEIKCQLGLASKTPERRGLWSWILGEGRVTRLRSGRKSLGATCSFGRVVQNPDWCWTLGYNEDPEGIPAVFHLLSRYEEEVGMNRINSGIGKCLGWSLKIQESLAACSWGESA